MSYKFKPQKKIKTLWTKREPPKVRFPQRKLTLERDNFKCRRCGCAVTLANAHEHHITPLSKGGTNAQWNRVTLCEACHHKFHKHDF